MRLGAGPITARGIAGDEVRQIARIIDEALMSGDNAARLDRLQREVRDIYQKFPVQT